MSKNAISIEQLKLSCRHFQQLRATGMSENLAIRSVELFANLYAKFRVVGRVNVDHVNQYGLWSKAALTAKRRNPTLSPGLHLRVEHGTPRRHFARLVLKLNHDKRLSKRTMDNLCKKYWSVAVITLEEDQRLNKSARSSLFPRPADRWASAKIKF